MRTNKMADVKNHDSTQIRTNYNYDEHARKPMRKQENPASHAHLKDPNIIWSKCGRYSTKAEDEFYSLPKQKSLKRHKETPKRNIPRSPKSPVVCLYRTQSQTQNGQQKKVTDEAQDGRNSRVDETNQPNKSATTPKASPLQKHNSIRKRHRLNSAPRISTRWDQEMSSANQKYKTQNFKSKSSEQLTSHNGDTRIFQLKSQNLNSQPQFEKLTPKPTSEEGFFNRSHSFVDRSSRPGYKTLNGGPSPYLADQLNLQISPRSSVKADESSADKRDQNPALNYNKQGAIREIYEQTHTKNRVLSVERKPVVRHHTFNGHDSSTNNMNHRDAAKTEIAQQKEQERQNVISRLNSEQEENHQSSINTRNNISSAKEKQQNSRQYSSSAVSQQTNHDHVSRKSSASSVGPAQQASSGTPNSSSVQESHQPKPSAPPKTPNPSSVHESYRPNGAPEPPGTPGPSEDPCAFNGEDNSSGSGCQQSRSKSVSFSREFSIRAADLNDYIYILHTEMRRQGPNNTGSVYKNLVGAVLRKAFADLRSRSKSRSAPSVMGHVLSTFDPSEPDVLTQVAPNVFRARVTLENPFPAGTFQLLSGVRHGVPSGQGLLCIHPAGLTMVERRQVMKTYKHFFDGEFLSPAKTSAWIHKGLQESLKAIHGNVVEDTTIQVRSQLQDGRITVHLTVIQDSKAGVEMSVRVFPAIHTSGWPSSASLQHPLPRQKPHSVQGLRMLSAVQEKLEAGAKLLCLDGTARPHTPRARTPSNAAVVHKASSAAIVGTNAWTVSYRLVEKYILDKLFQYDFMRDAAITYDILGLIHDRNPRWCMLTPALRRTFLLWTVKRAGIDDKTPADWLVAFIQYSQKAFGSGFCPQFFQPNVNMLSGVDKESFKHVSMDMEQVLEVVDKQPDIIVRLCNSTE